MRMASSRSDRARAKSALSRVARAIRRYSTDRAHERWDECATALARLGDDLGRAAESGEQVVLCLRCAALETGADALGHHRGAGCVAVELSAKTRLQLERRLFKRPQFEQENHRPHRGLARAARDAAPRDRGLSAGPRCARPVPLRSRLLRRARSGDLHLAAGRSGLEAKGVKLCLGLERLETVETPGCVPSFRKLMSFEGRLRLCARILRYRPRRSRASIVQKSSNSLGLSTVA